MTGSLLWGSCRLTLSYASRYTRTSLAVYLLHISDGYLYLNKYLNTTDISKSLLKPTAFRKGLEKTNLHISIVFPGPPKRSHFLCVFTYKLSLNRYSSRQFLLPCIIQYLNFHSYIRAIHLLLNITCLLN